MLYINHSGKYIEINFNMKIPFSAEPEVSGRTPLSGQSPPLRRPVRT